MYELRPAPKARNPIWLILTVVGSIIALPFAYAALLIVGAFLKGFLGF